jgi:hypothetical protein
MEKTGVRIDVKGLFGKTVKPCVHVSPDGKGRRENFSEIIKWVLRLSRRKKRSPFRKAAKENGRSDKNDDSTL